MSNSTTTNDKMKDEILLAKRMFYAGCLGLPWLWICNVLYFRLAVFGPCVILDYRPGHRPLSSSTTTNTTENDDNEESTDEQRLNRQLQHMELKSWVQRSTYGASIIIPLFVAWIITFQVNKEHFGPKWFVLDQSESEVTGW